MKAPKPGQAIPTSELDMRFFEALERFRALAAERPSLLVEYTTGPAHEALALVEDGIRYTSNA